MRFREILSKVKQGYKKSGFKPCSGAFLRKKSEVCCPLTAMLYAEGCKPKNSDQASNLINKKYGRKWSRGFWKGVDGLILYEDERDNESKRGHQMGQKVKEALGL